MPLTLRRRYLLGALLGLCGLWLNEVTVPLLTQGTPQFVFGGAAVMVCFVSLGTGPGLMAALISLLHLLAPRNAAALATLVYVVEAWAACLLYRRYGSLVFAVTAFWFSAGFILDLVVYGGMVGLTQDFLTLLFIKQVFNGILNALIAEAVLRLPGVRLWLPARDSILPASLKQYVFNRVVFVVMIPALALAMLFTRTAYQGHILQAQAREQHAAQELRTGLREFLLGRATAIGGLARRLETDGAAQRVAAQSRLDHFRQERPEFQSLSFTNAQGVEVAGSAPSGPFGGALDEVTRSLIFKEARAEGRTIYTSLAAGPHGGRENPEPLLIVTEPLLDGQGRFRGTISGTLGQAAFAPLLASVRAHPDEIVTLFDQDYNVIFSSDPHRRAGDSLKGYPPVEDLSGPARSFAYFPRPDGTLESELAINLRHASFQRDTLSGLGALVDLPARSLHRDMMPTAYRILLFLVLTLLLLYAVVTRFARRVSEPLLAINGAANDIAAGRFPVEASLEGLARNPIEEIQSVAFHFLTMRDALAYRDTLTGLPNRQLFLDRLGLALVQARRSREGLAVLYLDLDRFRLVEDSLGHATGNELLRIVAERLQSSVREGDTVARLGADEFVVLVRQVNHGEDAARVARKLLDGLRPPFVVQARELMVTGSVGISFYPSDGEEAETLLNAAHMAMHRAKSEGWDTYRLYTAAMNDRALEQLALEVALRKAVGQGEFVVHYQPLLDLRSGRVEGAEALVRWQHPSLGLLGAHQFISLAEASGLIVSIDSWVLRTACARAVAWRRQGWPHLRVEANLSARQFQQRDLVDEVTRCLQDTGLPAEALEIEITERIAMQDVARSVEILRALRRLGVRISLDDFGTGYSSLSYLKTLPVDTVKLDQSFVRDITTDPGDAAIATAVIAMAHSLDLRVVAEGVETREQLSFLRDQGCDSFQGHLFSAAVPGDFIAGLLEQSLDSLLSQAS
ncbi:MAG TPA: EAL domain-containing protein [Vicinamibacteria bacterium]|jgi:diguanylate cyclase (GGDEF)-like protein|nr:EAL domain-containing protein [Vicinamibacteria bacterium]